MKKIVKLFIFILLLGLCSCANPPINHCIVTGKGHREQWFQPVVTNGSLMLIPHPEEWWIDVTGIMPNGLCNTRRVYLSKVDWVIVVEGQGWKDIL